jgi:hypothetical protein
MPAASYQIPGGAKVLVFTCETCGGPAHFSEDAHILEAVHTGKVERAGRWYCGRVEGKPVCVSRRPEFQATDHPL